MGLGLDSAFPLGGFFLLEPVKVCLGRTAAARTCVLRLKCPWLKAVLHHQEIKKKAITYHAKERVKGRRIA